MSDTDHMHPSHNAHLHLNFRSRSIFTRDPTKANIAAFSLTITNDKPGLTKVYGEFVISLRYFVHIDTVYLPLLLAHNKDKQVQSISKNIIYSYYLATALLFLLFFSSCFKRLGIDNHRALRWCWLIDPC